MSAYIIATVILGLAELGFLTWIGYRHAGWWRRVLIPSLCDAWRRPLSEHIADGYMALQEVRSINTGRSKRLLRSGPQFMRRFWSKFMSLSEENQRATSIAAIAVAGTGAASIVDGLTGFLVMASWFVVVTIGIAILMPLVARRERDELTRRNKDERSRRQEEAKSAEDASRPDDDPED